MSEHIDSADGGAMPEESRPSTLLKIADELDSVEALVEAAFLASRGLELLHERHSMSALIDVASDKLKAVRARLDSLRDGESANG